MMNDRTSITISRERFIARVVRALMELSVPDTIRILARINNKVITYNKINSQKQNIPEFTFKTDEWNSYCDDFNKEFELFSNSPHQLDKSIESFIKLNKEKLKSCLSWNEIWRIACYALFPDEIFELYKDNNENNIKLVNWYGIFQYMISDFHFAAINLVVDKDTNTKTLTVTDLKIDKFVMNDIFLKAADSLHIYQFFNNKPSLYQNIVTSYKIISKKFNKQSKTKTDKISIQFKKIKELRKGQKPNMYEKEYDLVYKNDKIKELRLLLEQNHNIECEVANNNFKFSSKNTNITINYDELNEFFFDYHAIPNEDQIFFDFIYNVFQKHNNINKQLKYLIEWAFKCNQSIDTIDNLLKGKNLYDYWLIQGLTNFYFTPLYFAARYNNIELINWIKNKLDMTTINSSNFYFPKQYPPLHVACELNNTEAVECLLREFNYNHLWINNNFLGITPLCITVLQNNLKLAEKLLNSGAETNINMNFTNLQMKRYYKHLEFEFKNNRIKEGNCLTFFALENQNEPMFNLLKTSKTWEDDIKQAVMYEIRRPYEDLRFLRLTAFHFIIIKGSPESYYFDKRQDLLESNYDLIDWMINDRAFNINKRNIYRNENLSYLSFAFLVKNISACIKIANNPLYEVTLSDCKTINSCFDDHQFNQKDLTTAIKDYFKYIAGKKDIKQEYKEFRTTMLNIVVQGIAKYKTMKLFESNAKEIIENEEKKSQLGRFFYFRHNLHKIGSYSQQQKFTAVNKLAKLCSEGDNNELLDKETISILSNSDTNNLWCLYLNFNKTFKIIEALIQKIDEENSENYCRIIFSQN